MTPQQFATTNLKRTLPSAIIAALCLSLLVYAGLTLIGLVEGHKTFFEGLEAEYDIIIGPKSTGLGMLLEVAHFVDLNEEVVPYGLVESLVERYEFDWLGHMHVFAMYKGIPVIAIEENFFGRADGMTRADIVDGGFFVVPGQVVLGRTAARELGLGVGDRFVFEQSPSYLMAQEALLRRGALSPDFDVADEPFGPVERPLYTRQAVVSGIVDQRGHPWDRAIYIHREVGKRYHQATHQRGLARTVSNDEAVTYIMLRLATEGEERAEEIKALQALLHHNSTAQVVIVEEELARWRAIAGQISAMADLAIYLIFLLIAISLCVLLNASFERVQPNLGVLRALGFTRAGIGTVLILEGMIILGVVLISATILTGLTFSFWVDFIGTSIPIASGGWWTARTLPVWLGSFVAVFVAAIVPLIRLYRSAATTTMRGL